MIGGNTEALLQARSVKKNAIGEQVEAWENVQTLWGWLDLSAGDSKYTTYNAKIQESTHVFIGDYVPLDLVAEQSRAVINGQVYDIMLLDNPMGKNMQWEIYLKYTGGQ